MLATTLLMVTISAINVQPEPTLRQVLKHAHPAHQISSLRKARVHAWLALQDQSQLQACRVQIVGQANTQMAAPARNAKLVHTRWGAPRPVPHVQQVRNLQMVPAIALIVLRELSQKNLRQAVPLAKQASTRAPDPLPARHAREALSQRQALLNAQSARRDLFQNQKAAVALFARRIIIQKKEHLSALRATKVCLLLKVLLLAKSVQTARQLV